MILAIAPWRAPLSAWRCPASTEALSSGSGTFSLYAALPVVTAMSYLVSLRAHSIVVGICPCLLGDGRLPGDKAEAELPGSSQESRRLRLKRLEPFLARARYAARTAKRSLQHRHPGELVRQVAGQIDFEWGLHVEQGFGLFTDRDLRDLERINEFTVGEYELEAASA